MRAVTWWAMLVSVAILSLAQADDEKDKEKNDKKSKIPPLTVIGYYDGEIMNADGGSDRLSLRYKEIVQKWVQSNQGAGANSLMRRMNGGQGGSYVAQEQQKDIEVNLSPDVKIRLMYTKPAPATPGAKKEKPLTAKEMAEKDPDYKLGGSPGKKSQLAKGQIVRITMGRNNDRINPQNYGMVVYVVTEGK